MELIDILTDLRNKRRQKKIVPEIFLLNEIASIYGKDPLPKLRDLWYKGIIKSCNTLNQLGFYFADDVQNQ